MKVCGCGVKIMFGGPMIRRINGFMTSTFKLKYEILLQEKFKSEISKYLFWMLFVFLSLTAILSLL